MAYFEPYIDADGIHVPSYADIMEYLEGQYKTIFGEDVYIGEETPDYQIMSVFGKCMEDFCALAIDAYNSRNPNYATGDALDTLVQLGGLVRRTSTASTVTLTVVGTENTDIEAGKQAIDQNGYIWTIQSDVTIPSAGFTTVEAVCETLGAVNAPIGTIDGIYTPVTGWASVTNEALPDVGDNTETDAELRLRFAKSHVETGSGLLDSIVSAIYKVTGVKNVSIVENSTNSTDANGLPPHSFCVIVSGGEDEDVAKKVFATKSPGVATYGNTTETVVDAYGNSNTVYFSRPTELTTAVTVTIRKFADYDTTDDDETIKNAIRQDIDSLGIGKAWDVTLGYRDIYSQYSGDIPFTITSISATNTHGTSTSTAACNFDETLVAGTITIAVTT